MEILARKLGSSALMGPNFQRGYNRIGRDRLPPGVVAILDDPNLLNSALCEMRNFIVNGNHLEPGTRAAVVFRAVSEIERDAYNWHVQRITDDINSCVGNLEGFRHTLDIEHIRHIHNRHSCDFSEAKQGQIGIVEDDFFRIPEIVYPKNLTACKIVEALQCLVYEKKFEDGKMTAVQEIRTGRKELAVVTLYKHK